MSEYAILKDRKVEHVEFKDWITWSLEGQGNRRVCLNNLPNKITVSTVFLGLNHGWDDKQLWFETMIFGGEHSDYQDRYATWDEAVLGHAKALKLAMGEK